MHRGDIQEQTADTEEVELLLAEQVQGFAVEQEGCMKTLKPLFREKPDGKYPAEKYDRKRTGSIFQSGNTGTECIAGKDGTEGGTA